MTGKILVVNAEVLSFSGTTWMNMTLGSHSEALTIGPPQRLWKLKDQDLSKVCQIHQPRCEFWANFDKFWNRDENFFLALNAFSGKRVFLMDTASTEFVQEAITHPDVASIPALYVRDLRAITASYKRKNPDIDYIDSIGPKGWIYAVATNQFPKLKTLDQYEIVLRYEEVTRNPLPHFQTAGKKIGIEYDESALRFWEHEHHITAGSASASGMVRLYQGAVLKSWRDRDLYRTELDRMIENPDVPFLDDRWKSELSREDLFYFNELLGCRNAALGYERDHFTRAEEDEFMPKFLVWKNSNAMD